MNLDRPTWGSVRRGDVFLIPHSAEAEYCGKTYVVVGVSQARDGTTSHRAETKLTVLVTPGGVESWAALRDDDYMPDVLLREGER